MIFRGLIFFLVLIFASSCTKEKTSGPDVSEPGQSGSAAPASQDAAVPGQYTLEIGPEDAIRGSVLFLVPKGFVASDAEITWFVNRIPVVLPDNLRYSSADLKKGDAVQVVANVRGTEVVSNLLSIKNAPPVMSGASLRTQGVKQGDIMGVEVSGSDIDGDEVTFTYEWTRNGEPAGNGKVLEGPTKKGDKIIVKITPYDGQLYGRPGVLTTELYNLPPVIGEGIMTGFDGNTVTYQVVASDPDGDPLTYSLKSELSGMTIIPDSGLVRWKIPQDFAGTADFTVMVKDGQGGETSQMVRVNVPEP